MTQTKTRYALGPDVTGDLHDSQGRLVDDAYVDAAIEDVHRRTRGRPSLSGGGESPVLRVRLSPDLDEAIRRAAEKAGRPMPEWVRDALANAVGVEQTT